MALALNAQSTIIPLWPDGAPTSSGLEQVAEARDGNIITNVSQPLLEVFPAQNPNGKIIICCPGGAYIKLAWGHEGVDMAEWLNSQGITLAVLKYRMPNGHKEIPLEDSRRAIEIVRERAAEWGGDPSKVGIMGSSAGGHFAATLATLYGDAEHRPDFQILLYPVISMEDGVTHGQSRTCLLGANPTADEIFHYSLSNQVTAQTPPAFIALSSDDNAVPPLNALQYAAALSKAGVPYSMHIYPTGGHGWGYRKNFAYHNQWTAELENWLEKL